MSLKCITKTCSVFMMFFKSYAWLQVWYFSNVLIIRVTSGPATIHCISLFSSLRHDKIYMKFFNIFFFCCYIHATGLCAIQGSFLLVLDNYRAYLVRSRRNTPSPGGSRLLLSRNKLYEEPNNAFGKPTRKIFNCILYIKIMIHGLSWRFKLSTNIKYLT